MAIGHGVVGSRCSRQPGRFLPRELGATHEPAPIAHFEPQPKPDTGGQQNKPYVVWSSAPVPSEPTGGREPEE